MPPSGASRARTTSAARRHARSSTTMAIRRWPRRTRCRTAFLAASLGCPRRPRRSAPRGRPGRTGRPGSPAPGPRRDAPPRPRLRRHDDEAVDALVHEDADGGPLEGKVLICVGEDHLEVLAAGSVGDAPRTAWAKKASSMSEMTTPRVRVVPDFMLRASASGAVSKLGGRCKDAPARHRARAAVSAERARGCRPRDARHAGDIVERRVVRSVAVGHAGRLPRSRPRTHRGPGPALLADAVGETAQEVPLPDEEQHDHREGRHGQPGELDRPVGAGGPPCRPPDRQCLMLAVAMNTRAKANSFQAKSACSSAEETRMGRHSGSTMRQKICAVSAPSM